VKKTYTILLDSINQVKDFANMINRFHCDVDLSSGRYVIDAKSIMGIFSLDLQSPLTLTIYGDNETDEAEIADIEKALQPFLVKK